MALQIDAGFEDIHAFGFKKLSLKRGIGLADQDLAILADDAVPGDAFSRRSGSHGAPRASCSAAQTQSSSYGPIR